MVVIGDSRLVIKALISQKLPKDSKITSILSCITKLSKELGKVTYHHILRENNAVADGLANEAAKLSLGAIKKMGF